MAMTAKKSQPPELKLNRLVTPEELAKQRFGDTEGLAIVRKSTMELARHYADRFELDLNDPEVILITSALAFTRHKEFTLLIEVERDLFIRVTECPEGKSYGEVLFSITKTGAYKDIHREIDRLHNRSRQYIKELKELAKEQSA